jgi:hypothetical protein
MAEREVRPDISAHVPGTPRGEERVQKEGREAGRENVRLGRTARDSTSINAAARDPIDPAMPHLPPP